MPNLRSLGGLRLSWYPPAAKTLYAIRKKSVRDSDFCNRKSSKFAKNPIFLEFLCRKCGFWAPKTRPNENASFFQQDPCRKPETAEGRSPVAVSGFRQGSISNYHIPPKVMDLVMSQSLVWRPGGVEQFWNTFDSQARKSRKVFKMSEKV